MAKKEISVWIRAKDGFSQMFRRVGTHLDRLRSRAATVFRAVGGAARLAGVGIAALAGAAALAVRAFTKQEDAEAALTAALQRQGQATQENIQYSVSTSKSLTPKILKVYTESIGEIIEEAGR